MSSAQSVIQPGIRGFLIVLTVLLFGVPGNFMAHARSVARALENPAIRQFTDPAQAAFDPSWSALVYCETAGFTILAIVSFLVLWPLFFIRHRFFRPAFALVAIAVSSLLIGRAVLATAIPSVAPAYRSSILAQTALWLPVSLVLTVYVIRSRRAQLTFRHRLMLYPMFPFFTRT
jgi:hypothetical protein